MSQDVQSDLKAIETELISQTSSLAKLFFDFVSEKVPHSTKPLGKKNVEEFVGYISKPQHIKDLVNLVSAEWGHVAISLLLEHELNNMLENIKFSFILYKRFSQRGSLEKANVQLEYFYKLSSAFVYLLLKIHKGVYQNLNELVQSVVPANRITKVESGVVNVENLIGGNTMTVTMIEDLQQYPNGAIFLRQFILSIRTLIDNAFKESSITSLSLAVGIIPENPPKLVAYITDNGIRDPIISERISEGLKVARLVGVEISAKSGLKLAAILAESVGGELNYSESEDGTKTFEIIMPLYATES